ncbi:MAG TPA: hypothetical protein VFU02_08810 [Polyangiaceae bacterium]|nr:hypothetical protein [Polyangiaceae bacterium]
MTHCSRLAVLVTLILSIAMIGCGSEAGSDPSVSGPSGANVDSVQQQVKAKALTAPVTGTIDGASFSGILRVTSFVVENDQIVALAQVTEITVLDGNPPKRVIKALKKETLRLPVGFAQPGAAQLGASSSDAASINGLLAACDVLFLQLGPLDLNLLGVVVHLDQVTLDIDAQTGGGELLGNLICAIVSLLDPLVFLQSLALIADLLNQIIDLIGSI